MRNHELPPAPEYSICDVLHHVNNMAAKILTKAELALRSDDQVVQSEALTRIATFAETLGEYTRSMRDDLLDRAASED